jgi:hypothetical protein
VQSSARNWARRILALEREPDLALLLDFESRGVGVTVRTDLLAAQQLYPGLWAEASAEGDQERLRFMQHRLIRLRQEAAELAAAPVEIEALPHFWPRYTELVAAGRRRRARFDAAAARWVPRTARRR